MLWLCVCCAFQLVLSENGTPQNSEADYSSRSVASKEECKTDLYELDYDIMEMYDNPSPSNKRKLTDSLHLYLKNLRRLNKMTKIACEKTSQEATRLVHSGGPHFLKTYMFYSDEEKVLRLDMQFTDLEFQEYQFYRLDIENEWSELKDQIAHLDRDKEKEREKKLVF